MSKRSLMSVNKIGYFLITLGILGVIFSFSADFFGLGKPGLQAAQILGVQLGAIVTAIGFGFIDKKQNDVINIKNIVNSIINWIINLPTIVWVIIGFLIAYVVLYIFPVFFNPEHRILYFNRYIPDKYPIGLDLSTIAGSISTWFSTDGGPYQNPNIFYPPLHHVLLAPILLLAYPQRYYLVVTLALICLFILVFLIPALANKKGNMSIPVFFLVTILFSYGFQFELERGQFNVITFTLCITAIYLFYYHKRFRYLAYLLFSFSVHLRIYPAIFIVMFIENWASMQQNIKRILGIGIFNVMLLFVLGPSVLSEFFIALSGKLGTTWTWSGNHSTTAFVYNLTNSGFGLFTDDSLIWLKERSIFITLSLLMYFIICFLTIFIRDFTNKRHGFNPDLLLICTIGGMIIPSVSHDYKLALLAGPLALALSNRKMASTTTIRNLFSALLIVITSLAYSITLFPQKYRPQYLESSFPLLMVILTTITLISLISGSEYLGIDDSEKIHQGKP